MRTPGKQRSRAGRRAIAALLLAAGAALAAAAPYIPVSDTTVLERVPARAALERLAPLRQAVAAHPHELDAALILATLLELKGDFAGARPACARLARAADALIAITCLASIDGRSGRLAESYERLRASPADDARLPADTRAWTLAVRAEMAERLGDDASAAFDYVAALETSPQDPYLKAAYADLLLRTGRPGEVLTLLAGSEAQDPLLLRLAIAGHRLGSPEAVRWTEAYQERLRAAARDHDATHLREAAIYLLEVRGDAAAALESAKRNWAAQREPADLRIYARAAEQTHATADVAQIARWLRETRYEDRTLCGLTRCGALEEAP